MTVLTEETKLGSCATSTATTPSSVLDEEKFLVPYVVPSSKSKTANIDLSHLPYAIIAVSFIQVCYHLVSNPETDKVLRFEPYRRSELWRIVTYMLVHDDWSHLSLNVVMQCIFASLLEKRQGWSRVVTLYVLGGATGVLGASCFHPDLVVGASAGGYALLISNASNIILNYDNLRYKIYRAVSIAVLVIFDILYDVIHVHYKKEPLISWETHFVGGIAGFLLGLTIFKSETDYEKSKTVNKALFWTGLIFYCSLMISFVILTLQMKRCDSSSNYRTVYLC